MNLPAFWRRASFAVSEAAELIGVPEMTLRTWMARAPFNDFLGAKTGNRVFLSCQDIYFYLLVKELTRYGVPVRTAMLQAGLLANEATEELPADELLVVRHDGEGIVSFDRSRTADLAAAGILIVPLRSAALRLIADAAVVYLDEAA